MYAFFIQWVIIFTIFICLAIHIVPLATSSHFPNLFQKPLLSEAWSSPLRLSEQLTPLCASGLCTFLSLYMFLVGYLLVSIFPLDFELFSIRKLSDSSLYPQCLVQWLVKGETQFILVKSMNEWKKEKQCLSFYQSASIFFEHQLQLAKRKSSINVHSMLLWVLQ